MQRVNYLFKDKNPNYKNGRFEWRKNNTLIIGRIHKIFDKENRLIELEFEKLTELVPFHATFDCEMTPDYIDGGHGLQDPRLYAYQDKLQMLFNGREQRSAPFEPCEQVPNRGIYAGQLSIIDREVKLISPNMLHLSSASRIERNWIPLESEKQFLIVYSIYPALIIYEKEQAEMVLHTEIDTTMSFENIFANIAQAANMTIKNVKRTIELHGSSPIIKVKDYLLGVLHCHYSLEESTARIYLNYFFKMDVLTNRVTSAATKRLPLTYEIDAKYKRLNHEKWYYAANYPSDHQIAFVSDITLDGDDVIIAYGAGDAESRVFIIAVNDLDFYFQP